MALRPGHRVRLKTDPGRIGIVTDRMLERRDLLYVQVQFHDGPQYVPADHLVESRKGFAPPHRKERAHFLTRGRF